MRLRSRLIRMVVLSVLSPFFPTLPTPACSIVSSTVKVGKEFRVQVTNHGKPIHDLELGITSDKSATKIAVAIYETTDANGYAHFSNLAPGPYYLKPVSDSDMIDGLGLEVTTKRSTSKTISLDWPAIETIQVRSASGAMRGPDYYPRQSQVPLSLSLSEGITGHTVGNAETDSNGRFQFKAVPPGVYYLHLNPSGLRSTWSGEEIDGRSRLKLPAMRKTTR